MKIYNFKFLSLAVFSLLIFLTSCQKEEVQSEDVKVELEEVINTIVNKEVPKDIIDKLDKLKFNTKDIAIERVELPDGTVEEQFLVEGDINITEEQIDFLLKSGIPDYASKQYRTYNLVASPQVITVTGWTGGGGYGLSTKMRTALSWAIANYNSLPIGLTFSLTFGTSTASDIVVYRLPNGQVGGRAGFPYGNGNPYKWVRMYSGLDSPTYSTNVVEHVTTHEIGHCLGLRHTDWFTRFSCGSYNPESANPVGAVFIPGTLVNDPNSVMQACFNTSEDGEFGYYDRVALNFLY